MAEPRVTGLRGIELAVFDLAASAAFYKECWALDVVGRSGDRAFLRAAGDEHHVLTLRQSPRAGVERVNFAAPDRATVEALHARAVAMGAKTHAPQALDAQEGGGYGFEIVTPEGQLLRVSSDVARHADVDPDLSRPTKVNHVVLNAADMDLQMKFFCDMLGFKFSDCNGHMNFIRCSANHHSIALAKSDGPSLNHVAFEMENFDGLMRGVGRMRLAEHELGWGVGRHAGPGRNIFSYFVDPNGFAIEYTTDVDQVDDTYVSRSGDYWANLPLRPCAWAGAKMMATPRMREAMGGKLIAAANAAAEQSCDDAISNKMAG
jgi:catechol 2,3-dioxygenase